MKIKLFIYTIVLFICTSKAFCQTTTADSNIVTEHTILSNEKSYDVGNGKIFVYTKPKPFSFLTNLPKDFAGIGKAPFKKNAVRPVLLVAVSTAILILADQSITDGVGKFSNSIHLSAEENYKNVLNIKAGKTDISLFKAPQNFNTTLYQLGQGFPSLLIGAGLFTYGKIHKDYRALNTANQLAESFILMGVGTQFLKRISGRQTPLAATKPGGAWHFLPPFKSYQSNTPYYDAFPSGHLATLMSTVTVLTDNYPEKKWIKPVGYSITGLVGYAMINNKVHWAGDYPLAIALGYLCAKQVVKHNRRVIKNSTTSFTKQKGALSYSFDYANGRIIPGVVYKF
jgi:membrane-associated phospholipid phosphatase